MLSRWKNRRIDVVEMALVVLCVGGVSWMASDWWHVHPEEAWFRSTYGPSRNSMHSEEWIIRDFFKTQPNGFFVDVGANDYQKTSNTYYLETELGWSGIAIEPLQQFEEGYRQYRPRTKFFPFFVSDRSDDDIKIYLRRSDSLVTSASKGFTETSGSGVTRMTRLMGEKTVEMSVPSITLDELLESEGVTAIDFLSMDIELAEPRALAGFDIERFRPALVCIEAHFEVRQQILNYFTHHGYVVVGRYLRADTFNLYFSPLQA